MRWAINFIHLSKTPDSWLKCTQDTLLGHPETSSRVQFTLHPAHARQPRQILASTEDSGYLDPFSTVPFCFIPFRPAWCAYRALLYHYLFLVIQKSPLLLSPPLLTSISFSSSLFYLYSFSCSCFCLYALSKLWSSKSFGTRMLKSIPEFNVRHIHAKLT